MNRSISLFSCLSLILVILLFIISRLNYLNLPFYWDEAWSYATAVFHLAGDEQPVFTRTIDPDLIRGHPPLFYYLSALWVKAFGRQPVIVHIFPLVVSVLFLLVTFFATRDLYGEIAAVTALVLLPLQTLFLAQATQLLPEVMLALWTLLTVYTYFKKKWILFWIFSILLVMTKETGMVLIGTILLDKLVLERFFTKGQPHPAIQTLRESLAISIPALTFMVLMILHKIRYGWFLYPEHMDLTVLNLHDNMNRVLAFLSRLFLHHGRIAFLLTSTALFVHLLIKKQISRHIAHFMGFSILFILMYAVFSSVNFFTTRYLISTLPFYFMIGSWLISAGLKRNWQRAGTIALLSLIFALNTVWPGKQNEQDTSLGYKNTVLLQKQAVNFAEDMQWQQRSVYATFLMQYYLTIPDLGYLNYRNEPFMEVSNKMDRTYELYIFCSNENDPLRRIIQDDRNYRLLKRWEQRMAWVEWYGVVK